MIAEGSPSSTIRAQSCFDWARILGVLVAFCSSLLGTGCYTYRSLAEAPLITDERVRLTLTDSGAIAMRGYLGADVATVAGRLQGRSDRGFEVAIVSTELRSGALREWNGELATIPSIFVAHAELRHLSVSKSALATGGILGLAIAAARAFGGPTSNSVSGRVPPPRS